MQRDSLTGHMMREYPGAKHTKHESETGMPASNKQVRHYPVSVYALSDPLFLQSIPPFMPTYIQQLKSIDELLERDAQREKDGFPRKIKIGRLISPSRGGKEKIVVVPTTVEEKFYHDSRPSQSEEEGMSSGSGEGDEGEVIGEEPMHNNQDPGKDGPGHGEGEGHEIDSNAYDLGRILTEKFELPNLKDKGKRRSLKRYTYDLTDRHKGVGQVLDKKATLKKIIETNMNLRHIPDMADMDPSELIVSPRDMIYRILSKEKDYESQAMVFFLRDYSGSMSGEPTELVVSQHVMIYSWLLYQYEQMVDTRFILHDTQAKEVKDFYTYYNSMVAGGTRVVSAFKLVNEIVASENLARDYNIYIFYGTDGDDWDTNGKEAIQELRKMLIFSNRIGVTIAKSKGANATMTTVEKYINDSKLLEDYPNQIRMSTLGSGPEESRIIEGIKKLIS